MKPSLSDLILDMMDAYQEMKDEWSVPNVQNFEEMRRRVDEFVETVNYP